MSPEPFVHARSSVDFITTIVGLKVFGTHRASAKGCQGDWYRSAGVAFSNMHRELYRV
jgi:hypothetical protein